VVVPGEGGWTVDGEVLVFTPEPAFVATATPVAYQVNTVASAAVELTATPTVTAAPVVPPTLIVTVPDECCTRPRPMKAVVGHQARPFPLEFVGVRLSSASYWFLYCSPTSNHRI
jgi:hypothetical protein